MVSTKYIMHEKGTAGRLTSFDLKSPLKTGQSLKIVPTYFDIFSLFGLKKV